MIAMFATLVFATAGCAGAAVIATSIRNAVPGVRRVLAEHKVLSNDPLALDRVYLVSLIETPRHDGSLAPIPTIATPERVVAKRFAAKSHMLRGGARLAARPIKRARVHAAA